MKKQGLLSKKLTNYPVLNSFLNEFEFEQTDAIPYKKWIDHFSKAMNSNSSFLPFICNAMVTSEGTTEKHNLKEQVQKIINKSPHAAKHTVNYADKHHRNVLAVTVENARNRVKSRVTRQQPSRKCKTVNHYY